MEVKTTDGGPLPAAMSTKNEDATSSCGSDVDYTCPHGGGDQYADARDDQNAESDAEDRSVRAEHIANFTTVKKAKHAGEYAQTKPLGLLHLTAKYHLLQEKRRKYFNLTHEEIQTAGPDIGQSKPEESWPPARFHG